MTHGRTHRRPTAGLTDIGYTGHRHNNLGSAPNDIGLIYMNARYYLPGLGRFISADTIVPNPTNPQSYNRYSYVRNNALNLTDPSGHQDIACETNTCGGGGSTTTSPASSPLESLEQSSELTSSEELPDMSSLTDANAWPAWTYSRRFPDYFTIQASPGAIVTSAIGAPFLAPITVGFTIDDYSNVYVSVGGSASFPDVLWGSVRAAGGWILAAQESAGWGVEWQDKSGVQNSPTEAELENFLTGWAGGFSGGIGIGADILGTLSENPMVAGGELGLYTPQVGAGASHGWLLYDNGNSTPWIWQRK